MDGGFSILSVPGNPRRKVAYFPISGCYRGIGFNSKDITDPSIPHVFGVGYYAFFSIEELIVAENSGAWKTWNAMLARCFAENRQSSYRNVSICRDWHDFNRFKEWYDAHHVNGWCLDKDLLSNGKKIYSADTCCFLPSIINVAIKEPTRRVGHDSRGYFIRQYFKGTATKIYLPSHEECVRTSTLCRRAYMTGLIAAYSDKFCPLDRLRIINAIRALD